MKKIIFSLFSIVIAIFLISVTAYCGVGTIINNKAYVPVRGVFEELGFQVSFDNATATAVISNEDFVIKVPKDKTYFVVNDTSIKSDSPQKIVDGSLYLPLRAIGDSIGAAISWNGESKLAHISYNGKDSYVFCKASIATPVKQTVSDVSVQQESEGEYVLNTNTRKFHKPNCKSVTEIYSQNKQYAVESREQIIKNGYKPCKKCNP